MKLRFSQQILEKYTNSNFMKIRPVGAELFHAEQKDRQRNSTKQIVAFCRFSIAPNNGQDQI
jgi:hypothetical protein